MIADTETYYEQYDDECPELDNSPDGIPGGISQCPCPICIQYSEGKRDQRIPKFNDYEEIYLERTKALTEHQYLLCAASIWAFHVDSRSWRTSAPDLRAQDWALFMNQTNLKLQ